MGFTHAVCHVRDGSETIVAAEEIPTDIRDRLTATRAPVAGLSLDRPRLMGILNVTPDSFSDGGRYNLPSLAVARGEAMVAQGADLVDIGGESTRPGAVHVPAEAEIARVEPVIAALASRIDAPISIDTRKGETAQAAVRAGASLVNDVSGFTHDRMLAPFCAREDLVVCAMHGLGAPEAMHEKPDYDNVLLDVYDFLDAQVAMLVSAGIPRDRILVDPGIGFGKSLDHNLTLLRGLALLHGLGCGIVLGASRKGFIGRVTGAHPASQRMPGSIAAALAALSQGVQILRVHDVSETAQAVALWRALALGDTT